MDSYTEAERQAHGKKLAKAREAVAQAIHIAEILAKSAHAEGVPETRIAADLGVDRMTVRKWVGKRPQPQRQSRRTGYRPSDGRMIDLTYLEEHGVYLTQADIARMPPDELDKILREHE